MADNFLENHFEEYERRKAAWLRKKKHFPKAKSCPTKIAKKIERPEDEAL